MRSKRAIARIREEHIGSVAVVFLWSFLNQSHEQRVCARLREALPDVYICASHEIAPVIGEYERSATTVANAYVAPSLIAYIETVGKKPGCKGLSLSRCCWLIAWVG